MSLKIGAQCGSWALHLLLLAKACQTSMRQGRFLWFASQPALSVSSLLVTLVKWLCVSYRFRGKALPYKHVFGPRSLLPDQVINLNTVDPKTSFAINICVTPLVSEIKFMCKIAYHMI